MGDHLLPPKQCSDSSDCSQLLSRVSLAALEAIIVRRSIGDIGVGTLRRRDESESRRLLRKSAIGEYRWEEDHLCVRAYVNSVNSLSGE